MRSFGAMQYLLTTTCRVDQGRSREFFAEVQQWEEEAMASPHAPLDHAVYIDRNDPAKSLVLTRFDSKQTADRFLATGLHDRFRERLLMCSTEVSDSDTYDLFYAADASGHKVIYGEDA